MLTQTISNISCTLLNAIRLFANSLCRLFTLPCIYSLYFERIRNKRDLEHVQVSISSETKARPLENCLRSAKSKGDTSRCVSDAVAAHTGRLSSPTLGSTSCHQSHRHTLTPTHQQQHQPRHPSLLFLLTIISVLWLSISLFCLVHTFILPLSLFLSFFSFFPLFFFLHFPPLTPLHHCHHHNPTCPRTITLMRRRTDASAAWASQINRSVYSDNMLPNFDLGRMERTRVKTWN